MHAKLHTFFHLRANDSHSTRLATCLGHNRTLWGTHRLSVTTDEENKLCIFFANFSNVFLPQLERDTQLITYTSIKHTDVIDKTWGQRTTAVMLYRHLVLIWILKGPNTYSSQTECATESVAVICRVNYWQIFEGRLQTNPQLIDTSSLRANAFYPQEFCVTNSAPVETKDSWE